MNRYRTPRAPAQAQLKREGSRFLAWVFPVADRNAVDARLAELQARYPDATHHCWAYRLWQDGRLEERAEDDREPRHSAGAPILTALRAAGAADALAVVVRYFGGTKLGVGGLIRAYGDAARAVLAEVRWRERVPEVRLRVRYPFPLTGAVMRALQGEGVTIEEIAYGKGAEARIRLPLARREALVARLAGLGSGRVEVRDD